MMRKLFIVGVLLLGAMSVQAQENAAVVKTEKSTVKLSDKLLKKCEALMKDAQWYLKHKEFGKAKEKLAEIVAINPKDVQAKVLLEQCEQNTVQYGESAEKKPNKWSLGISGGADFLSGNFGVHFGLTARYGHYTDLVNATGGVEYQLHQGIGGQIIVPLMAKFNVLKVTEASRFYVGAGVEGGLNIYSREIGDEVGFIYSEAIKMMKGSGTVAGLVQVGVTGRHFDVGVYYRHYFTDLVEKNISINEINEKYGNDRIGVSATYYF